MANYVSKTGVWDIIAGSIVTPELKLTRLDDTREVKVTCQFFARTMTDDLNDGFEYRIVADDSLTPLTPIIGLVQGSDSWQLYTHIALFEVLPGNKEAQVDLHFLHGSMNGVGAMMNFFMLGEQLDLEWNPILHH